MKGGRERQRLKTKEGDSERPKDWISLKHEGIHNMTPGGALLIREENILNKFGPAHELLRATGKGNDAGKKKTFMG